MKKGVRHRTAHIWIVREQDGKAQLLLQKRSAEKDSFPGRFDTSSAGHIQAGDEPEESAIRELHEELGIRAAKGGSYNSPDALIFNTKRNSHGKMFRDNEVAFVYMYTKPVDAKKLILQKEEVESVEWFDMEELDTALQPPRDQRFCVPYGGLPDCKTMAGRAEDN